MSDLPTFDGGNALVTGAGNGIGAMLARRLAPSTLALLTYLLIPSGPCFAGPSFGKIKGALGRALANSDE
ncbi:MAG: hypothetical protein MK142_07720, partial [Pseudomonadales bacterium]|nr:hypothetical protein [Pseudomonadales bacterium]